MKTHFQKSIAFFFVLMVCIALLSSVASAVVMTKVGPVDLPELRTIRFNYAADPIDMGIYEIVEDKENNCLRIKEIKSGFWVVDANGEYPYTPAGGDVPDSPGQAPAEDIAPPSISANKFVHPRSVQSPYAIVTYDALSAATIAIGNEGHPCQVQIMGGNYYAIFDSSSYLYCNSKGQPYVALKGQSATDIKYDYIDNSTNNVINDSQILDIENGLFTYIDDSGEKVTLSIDSLYYDASTSTYNTTVYDQVFNVTNNYYEYNYYTYNVTYNYQYTYVTYIGSTPEYKKEFEYYYQLDDGRTSADLTPEDLAGLNIGFDVVNYDRVATDTNTRALYHFDGNWSDSSYYSNKTSLAWQKGASITYLDANAFNGCLYMDSAAHQFTSNLGASLSSDFTVQFRMYYGGGEVHSAVRKGTSSLYSLVETSAFSKLSMGGKDLLVWDSDGFYLPCLYNNVGANNSSRSSGNGYRIDSVPFGSWVDVCVERVDDSMYIFLNGVCYALTSGMRAGPSGINGGYFYAWPLDYGSPSSLSFNFYPGVNSLIYLDELRIVDFAVYTANYQPSPVPWDTNNVFVLPATENLKELTIAVQHDAPVTGFRVGGVRPTFPENGLVWFPVEKSRITDCQIYNGSYWESVECRLWTGVRWIPLWAFDVFTLADCFDMADSGVLPPITSETGFWSWWQKEWTSFRAWLTGALGGSGGGSGALPPDTLPNIPGVSEGEEGASILDIGKGIVSAIWKLVTGLFNVVFGGVASFFATLGTNIDGFFDAFGGDTGVFSFATYGGADIWD